MGILQKLKMTIFNALPDELIGELLQPEEFYGCKGAVENGSSSTSQTLCSSEIEGGRQPWGMC